MYTTCVVDARPVPEEIPELVLLSRFLVAEFNRGDTEIMKVLEFAALADALMIQILPEQELVIYSIFVVNQSVSVAAILRLVKYSEGEESVFRCVRRRFRLRGIISK